MNYNTIIYEQSAHTAVITFHRPEKRNALNTEMMGEIDAALAAAEADGRVKALILTGGGANFISGTDIEFLIGDGDTLTPQRMYDMHRSTQTVYRRLTACPKPTIAAMAGYALGGGLELALCCDFRIAADQTKLGTPEIKLGILPGAGGTQRLIRLVGPTRAKEMVLTGQFIDAGEAYQMGLLNKVVPVEALMTEATAFAARFDTLPDFAVQMAKAVIDTGMNIGLTEALEVERLGFAMLYSTEDQKEGLNAFLEKRKPVFQGR